MSNDTDRFYRTVAELDALLKPGLGEGFWSARPIFDCMDRAFLNGWSLCRLREIADGTDLLAFRDRDTLTINVTKGYAISLAMIGKPARGLYLYPQHYMARNTGRVPVTARRYRPSHPVNPEVYDPSVRLVLRDEIELAPGETLERNGYEDVLDWHSPGETGFLLRLHSESLGSYEWAFDRETLEPRGVTVLDSLSSQTTTVMQMIGALGTPVEQDFIEMGLASPHFHVRWETLKMAGRVAPGQVRDALERLKDDPHPAIRQAVERTLQRNAQG